jgi:hypothetical protein
VRTPKAHFLVKFQLQISLGKMMAIQIASLMPSFVPTTRQFWYKIMTVRTS